MLEQDADRIDQFCQQGEGGVELIVAFVDRAGVPRDISGFVNPQLRIQYPNDVTRLFTAELLTDGTDGCLRYVTEDIDLATQWGTHFIQGIMEDSDENTIYGEVKRFYVYANIVALDGDEAPMPVYIGNPTEDGSWRFIIDEESGNLLQQKRVDGEWVTKGTFTS